MKLVTPEATPLALFGRPASEAVAELLVVRGIELLTSTHPVEFASGVLAVVPAGKVPADRVVALPRLRGRPIEGVPHDADGFIEVDPLGRVHGTCRRVCGGRRDGRAPSSRVGSRPNRPTRLPLRSPRDLAHAVEPEPFRPVLRGTLLTGDGARFMRSEVPVAQGERSEVSAQMLWWPEGKIAGRHLSHYLARRAHPIEPEQPLTADAIPGRRRAVGKRERRARIAPGSSGLGRASGPPGQTPACFMVMLRAARS